MNDVKFAFRQLLKNPGFTVVAVLTLALGIGANTAIFSVVRHVLLRPLAFPEPERLVTVWERNPARGYEMNNVSGATFLDWQAQTNAFEGMAAFGFHQSLNLTGEHEPERVSAVPVSANLFLVLGVHPIHGRAFLKEDEIQGSAVVILSHALWHRRFGSDPNIVGKTVLLDGRSRTVVGVMPEGFVFPGMTGVVMGFFFTRPADIWTPLALPAEALSNRSDHPLFAVARLKSDVPLANAASQMDSLMQRIAKENSGAVIGTHAKLVPLREQSIGGVRAGLLVLFTAVAFVLLIACANVANLFLARATTRQKEIAIRVAVGASRGQIIRQLLTESVLLAVLAGLLGILFASWSLDAILTRIAESISITTPGWNDIRIDTAVLAFTFLVSLATGVIFGLVPARQATKLDLSHTLKEGLRSTTGSERLRLRQWLVATETALVMVLLAGAGLMLHSFFRLQQVNAGFDPSRVVTMELNLAETPYPEPDQWAAFYQQLLLRINALPGVQSAGLTTQLPLAGDVGNTAIQIEGRPPVAPGEMQMADWLTVTPGYFGAMQIPLHSGRLFTDRDQKDSTRVCLISRSLANRYFPNENPVGKRLLIGLGEPLTNEIVGIVKDVKQRSLDLGQLSLEMRRALANQVYLPYTQFPVWRRVNLVVRTVADPLSVVNALRREIASMDKDLPISRLQTMDMVRGNSIAQPRFRTVLIGLFALLALVLALIGIYGVVAYSVSQRTHEIGIRMALGAQARDVLTLIIRQGMTSVVIGAVIGLITALGLSRFLSQLLYEIKPTDPLTFTAVALLLLTAAFLACYFPARRSARLDPVEALRHE